MFRAVPEKCNKDMQYVTILSFINQTHKTEGKTTFWYVFLLSYFAQVYYTREAIASFESRILFASQDFESEKFKSQLEITKV